MYCNNIFLIVFIGFLTAMRQEVTRGHEGWALDNVTLHNTIMRYYAEDIKSPPDVGFTF